MAESNVLPVYPGWNVWSIYQVKDLPFSITMVGVSRDDQLKIWVEDAVRLGAPGADVADPVALKGSQVQILDGKPAGLTVVMRKEDLPGTTSPVVSGPAELRYVRFFNRGDTSKLNWPHDDSYLLNEVYQPSSTNPTTEGPGPSTITGGLASDVGKVGAPIFVPVLITLGVLAGVFILIESKKR